MLKNIIPKADKKTMAVTKLQIIAFVMLAMPFLCMLIPIIAITVIEAMFLAAFLFVLFVDAKKLFGKDFKAIAAFFVFLLVIIFASFAIQLVPFQAISLRFQLVLAIFIAILVFFFGYKLFFSRNFSYGTIVSSDKHSAIVETEFDFLAGINAGKYHIKTAKHFPARQKVKLKIGQGFFGRKPAEIIE